MKPVAFAIAAALFALPAAAQELNIPGDLGNEGGCVRAKGGTNTTDDVLILRKTEIEQYESTCEFIDVKQSKMGPQVVRSMCSGEGFFWIMDFVVSDAGEGQRVISFAYGERPEVVVGPCG